ncbi:MAG: dTDP-4-dehydrorhamnose reductase [Dysgonamonadaceae bacterium]|jgi:dTDP-4-dehydrorhamnose reductase|nr:dTDP-4-dehydrorhamnose reductase [Dysgonamonadaceae bacterium]
MQKKILVTGANGQLGKEIRRRGEAYPQFQFVYVDIDDLDLTDADRVSEYIAGNAFRYIVNCAAYTAVDKAEEDAAHAWKVNCDAILYLAWAARKAGATVIHISTDYVFDGTSSRPYREDDPVHPQSVYGKSKLAGETALTTYCPQSIIIRTAWLYSTSGSNFVKTMIRLGKEKDTLTVVSDQRGTPTYAGDLAGAILDIIVHAETHENLPAGVFHYSNEGETNWYAFAVKIHELAGIRDCNILPVSTADYPTTAKRPAYSVLDKDKIRQTFRLTIPDWEASLQTCINELIK